MSGPPRKGTLSAFKGSLLVTVCLAPLAYASRILAKDSWAGLPVHAPSDEDLGEIAMLFEATDGTTAHV